MIDLRDDVGRRVVLPHAAQRIVSLVPSLTETLFALGCGAVVVGVTRYCTEPPALPASVERVGGTKNPNLQRILALQPDLVLLNAEENRQEDFEALQHAGLTLFASFPRRVADTVQLLRRLGALTDTSTAAAGCAEELEQMLAATVRLGSGRRRVFCPIWKNPWMSFNRDTYADDLLSLAGGDNVCRDRAERYCDVTLDELVAAQPEIILLPDEPYVFAPRDLPALASLRGTPAWEQNRIHFIDGKALSWYGTRTAAGLRYLRRVVTPDPTDPHLNP